MKRALVLTSAALIAGAVMPAIAGDTYDPGDHYYDDSYAPYDPYYDDPYYNGGDYYYGGYYAYKRHSERRRIRRHRRRYNSDPGDVIGGHSGGGIQTPAQQGGMRGR